MRIFKIKWKNLRWNENLSNWGDCCLRCREQWLAQQRWKTNGSTIVSVKFIYWMRSSCICVFARGLHFLRTPRFKETWRHKIRVSKSIAALTEYEDTISPRDIDYLNDSKRQAEFILALILIYERGAELFSASRSFLIAIRLFVARSADEWLPKGNGRKRPFCGTSPQWW